MAKPFRIDCLKFRNVPSADHLRRMATHERHVVLQFSETLRRSKKRDLIRRLAGELPDHAVFDSGGSHGRSCVTVKRVISLQEVEENAEAILAAARDFRNTANALCHELAARRNVPVSELWDPRDRGGRLKLGWRYNFHGLQCRFKNWRTRQIVEVEITFGEEFGVLDPYFFWLFINSTGRHKSLGRIFVDTFHDVLRALQYLEKSSRLTRIRSNAFPWKTGVFACEQRKSSR